MKRTLFVSLVLVLILSACGGTGILGDSNPTTAPATGMPTGTPSTEPTLAATATSTVVVVPTATVAGLQTYSYTPGGEGFGKVASDVTNPAGQTNCIRVWQATNLVNLPWTAVFCNWKASNPVPKMQWPHPTQFTVSGTGTVEFDLYRDLASNSISPDPYVVANQQNSPLGLGWFTQGYNGTTCINDVCQDLSGGGVFQMSFPHDWTGHYHVVITVNNGQVQFWQGERVTSTDTWKLP